ncbi:MAG: kynureninase [Bacteroidetes bacterium]|nr:kynureninase [Bacteroidota bacterium]
MSISDIDTGAHPSERSPDPEASVQQQFRGEREFAARMDATDPLRGFRGQFHIPKTAEGKDTVYFCGNSLGLQPIMTRRFIEEELDDWARLGVRGHAHARHPWMTYPELLSGQVAEIVGAHPSEVTVMNTLTVNLHLLMVSFYRPTASRHRIILEQHAFPSDRYAAASQLHAHGYDARTGVIEIPMHDGRNFTTETVIETIHHHRDDAALLLLGAVNYYNGEYFDIPEITAAARDAGIVVGLDCAHAAGNVPLQLHDWNVDFAAWCSYKYLNAGPGSTAGCFVHERHDQQQGLPRFAGWWGHDKATRFEMPEQFMPMPGADGWQLSNPAILPLAALRASLDLFERAGMRAIRKKSELLTGYLEFLLHTQPSPHWDLITPKIKERRGSQLSLRVPTYGRHFFDYLSSRDVICDWREPDVIRIAPAPLYNSFDDAWRFADLFNGYFAATV